MVGVTVVASRLTSAKVMVLTVPLVLLVVVTEVDRSCHVYAICWCRPVKLPPEVPEALEVVVDRAVPAVSRCVEDLLLASWRRRRVRCPACRCRRSKVLLQTE